MGKKRLSKRRSLSKDRKRSEKSKSKVNRSNNERETNIATETRTRDDTSRGKHSETILSLRANLTMCVDTEYSLLDKLFGLKVITCQQVDEIRSKPTKTSRVEHLLNLIVAMPDEQQEQFLVALDNNQQTHVSEYIRAKGDLSDIDEERHPLYLCSEMRTIENNWAKLIELIDSKCGLLDELFAVGFLNERQMKSFKATEREDIQNGRLLGLMYYKSLSDLGKFLNCLERTKQCTVIPLLSTSYTCSEQPLNDATKSRLRIHRVTLLELINTEDELLAELYASDCITSRQRDYIGSTALQSESNSRLLEILKHGSESDFNKFIECLSKSGQKHVASLLMEDGVVMPVDAVTSCSASEETRIADQIMYHITSSLSQCTVTEQANVYDDLIGRLIELKSDVHLIAAKKQNSIGLFYLCRSLNGLQHLYDLFSSGRLKEVVERTFTLLVNNGTSVVVDSLHWNIHNYVKCVQCLCSSADLEVFCELYELPTNMHLNLVDCTISSLLRVDQLPLELLLLILKKAMGQLFVIIHRVTPRAAIYAMLTLGGVSTLWWRTITYRRYNKRLLKRYFQRVCSPFKCNPRRLQSLRFEADVWCLTEFSGQLYVGVEGSASVQVFVSRPPFSRLDDITEQGLNAPSDIIVCRDTSQLYIADYGSQYAIWRVNLLRIKQVDKFITIQWRPWSLSVNSRRLLITPYDGAALFLYSDDGSLLNHIKLPDYMAAHHAVETTHNTYIVSHRNRYYGDTQSEHNNVSEVNVDGQVVRTFNSQHIDIDSIQFNDPRYLALYDNNHVIVADHRNERVVVLNEDLKLKRVLMTSLGQQPIRLCLSKSTGIMFINYFSSSDIDIYKVVT